LREEAAVFQVPFLFQRLFDLAVDKIAFVDRRRRIRECNGYRDKPSSSAAQPARSASYYEAEEVWKRGVAGKRDCPPSEWTLDLFRSGVSLMEAFAAQLSELRAAHDRTEPETRVVSKDRESARCPGPPHAAARAHAKSVS
jgi:hypothetical protein